MRNCAIKQHKNKTRQSEPTKDTHTNTHTHAHTQKRFREYISAKSTTTGMVESLNKIKMVINKNSDNSIFLDNLIKQDYETSCYILGMFLIIFSANFEDLLYHHSTKNNTWIDTFKNAISIDFHQLLWPANPNQTLSPTMG